MSDYDKFDLTKLVAGEIIILRSAVGNQYGLYTTMADLSIRTCRDLMKMKLMKEQKVANLENHKTFKLTRLGKKIAKVLV